MDTLTSKLMASEPTGNDTEHAFARSITSALTRYAPDDSGVRNREDLHADVLRLLQQAATAGLPNEAITSKATEIAKARKAVELKVSILDEFGARPGVYGTAILNNHNPFKFTDAKKSTNYLSALSGIPSVIKNQSIEPTDGDALSAQMLAVSQSGSEDEQSLGKAIVHAAGYQKVSIEHGQFIEKEREAVFDELQRVSDLPLKMMSPGKRDPHRDEQLKVLDRVHAAFTDREITSMASPNDTPAKTLPTPVQSSGLAEMLPGIFGKVLSSAEPTLNSPSLKPQTFMSKDALEIERDRDGPSMGFI